MPSGFTALGDLIAGGGKGAQQNAFYQGQLQQGQVAHLSAQTQDALANAKLAQANAKMAQSKADEQDKLADHFQTLFGASPEEAHALAGAAVAGQGNFESLAKGRGELQTQNFRKTLADPTADPNARLGASEGITGKPESPLVSAPQENVNAFAPNAAGAPQVNQTRLGVASTAAKNRSGTMSMVDPEAVAAAARLINAGRAPLPTGRSMVTGPGAQIVKAVEGNDPKFDAATYPARAATEKSFLAGPDSTRVLKLNTSIAHMGTLDELTDALGNGDVKRFNQLRQFLAKETGKPAPTNLQAAAQLVGQEVVAAVVNNGGTGAERDAAEKAFENIQSPEVLRGVTKTYRTLLGGQVDSLANKYQVGTGKADFHKRFLTPKTRTALGIADETPAPGATPDSGTPTFKTEAEAEAAGLKPGTKIIVGGRSATWQ